MRELEVGTWETDTRWEWIFKGMPDVPFNVQKSLRGDLVHRGKTTV